MKRSMLYSIIQESMQNALNAHTEARGWDGGEEPKELRKARLAGSKQAREKFKDKSGAELQTAYLAIEKKAESELDPLKNTFLWGACEAIERMLKAQGLPLPKKVTNPWER